MKKSFIVLGLLFGTVTTPATFAANADFTISAKPATMGSISTEHEVLAAAGCCKQRSSESRPWKKTSDDLDSCKEKNDKKDRDNVFKPSGHYWWDVVC